MGVRESVDSSYKKGTANDAVVENYVKQGNNFKLSKECMFWSSVRLSLTLNRGSSRHFIQKSSRRENERQTRGKCGWVFV